LWANALSLRALSYQADKNYSEPLRYYQKAIELLEAQTIHLYCRVK
jgi:hypothetical protein